jgi:phosphoribosylformylglycinamidine cyclo-ligase
VRYQDAGVDPERKGRLIGALRSAFEATHGDAVVRGIGAFSGVYRAPAGGYLVATADGVGTKVLLARELGRDAGTARDLVHHCVNDCLAVGATPLFFLDYVAFGVLEPERMRAVVEGLTAACRAHGVALLGGETAEMPGVYVERAYDLVGFLVGHAAEGALYDPARVAAGDAVIGLASTGLHTNGYSLARKIVRDRRLDLASVHPGCAAPLGDLLLAEHRSYAAALSALRARVEVRGVAHITGGGIPENLPRALPAGLRARLDRARWPVPPVIALLAREGEVADEDALRAWNMGVGLAAIVPRAEAGAALDALRAAGSEAWEIGAVEAGEGGVVFA